MLNYYLIAMLGGQMIKIDQKRVRDLKRRSRVMVFATSGDVEHVKNWLKTPINYWDALKNSGREVTHIK